MQRLFKSLTLKIGGMIVLTEIRVLLFIGYFYTTRFSSVLDEKDLATVLQFGDFTEFNDDSANAAEFHLRARSYHPAQTVSTPPTCPISRR